MGLLERATTPFLPDDYLGLLNPLWSARELRGRVVAVRPEAGGAATLEIRPGRGWTGHLAGQYVGVGVDIDGVRHWRSYSLTSPTAVTVTPTPLGLVSTYLARRTPVGTVVRLRPAQGGFTWQPGRAALFLTAGSGLTPVAGMLRAMPTPLPDVVHLHSAATAGEVLFGSELRRLDGLEPSYRLVERHTRTEGRLTPDELDALVPDWRTRETWACGPAGLLDAVEEHWAAAGLSERLHVERFTPPVIGTGDRGEVTFVRSGVRTTSAASLLDAGEQAGVLMASGCRRGICYGCVVPLLSGQVRDARTGTVHGEPGDLVQTCISTPAGDCSLDA